MSSLSPTTPQKRSTLSLSLTAVNGCVMQPSSITRCSSAHHRDFRAVLHANRNFSTAGNPVSHATSSTNVWLIGAPSLLSPSFVLGASLQGDTIR